MIFNTASLLAATLLSSLALSSPLGPLGSKHNVYLIHCSPNSCPIGDCDPGEFTITAAAYFRNGPITETTSSITVPTSIRKLTGYQPKWEGVKRTVVLADGALTANIGAKAGSLKKGEIAGDATLVSEPFVCFRDGVGRFVIQVEGDKYTCTTEYWCPSIDASAPVPSGSPSRA